MRENNNALVSDEDEDMPRGVLSLLPSGMQDFFIEAGDTTRFALRFFKEGFLPPYEWREVLRQSYEIGYRSMPLVGLTAFIIGLVLTLQSRPTLVNSEQKHGFRKWLASASFVK